MPYALANRCLAALAVFVILGLCGGGKAKTPEGAPCALSHSDTANIIHPGDEISQNVILDSLNPVTEGDAFGDYLASRQLLECRKCKCLPRCSRCLVMSCKDGICSGFCKLPSATHKCEILRCSRTQEANTI